MMGSVIKNKYKCYFLNRLGRKGRLYTGYLLIVQLNVHDFVVEERNNKHSVNWRPPLIFRRNWGPRGRKIVFETAPSCLRVWMTPPLPQPPYLRVWIRHCLHPILSGEPHPENLNWHVVCLLTSFQGETATFSWLFIAVEQTGLRLFAIPNQCATPVHECWLRTAFIESPTAQAVIREEPFDYQVFVEMRICWRSPKRQWTDWGTEQDLKALSMLKARVEDDPKGWDKHIV